MSERQYISQGSEHYVVRGKTLSEWVFKTPFPKVVESLREKGLLPNVVREELEDALNMVRNTEVLIPKTRIFIFNRWNGSYIIAQEFTREDHTITDKRNFLVEHGNSFLVDEFDINPENFISNNDRLHWVDPVRGLVSRLLAKNIFLSKVLSYKDLRRLTAKWKVIGRKMKRLSQYRH